MHLSGALYMVRNSKPGKKVDESTLKLNSGQSSQVTVSEHNKASDGSEQQHCVCPNLTTRRAQDEDKPCPRRASSPVSKPTNTSSRSKDSSPRVASVAMGRGRSHSIGDLSSPPSDIVRTGSAPTRRSSLFSPDDPALAGDEDDVAGR
ncbi:hypothetical protein KVR01_003228 [Diaporthe batatas]|uniref:uncharacterized protein n=1 Tax=Diaporthe batatas TaxID=748121 RepID=UPI001D04A9BA|nr:uncharacterized protein KVR01_003228 [Diaporthe batatas]KAG8167539.1 hypothetical protein KVR01_003228 [Diaporthe batatas]